LAELQVIQGHNWFHCREIRPMFQVVSISSFHSCCRIAAPQETDPGLFTVRQEALIASGAAPALEHGCRTELYACCFFLSEVKIIWGNTLWQTFFSLFMHSWYNYKPLCFYDWNR
jgi:hypothetical protein